MNSEMQQAAPLKRQLAAILAADVVGYTRLMEADETGTHARLMNLRFSMMEPAIAAHHGKVVKNTGDGFMAMFASANAATQCAIEMQREVASREAGEPQDRRITFRMAINVADVIVEDHDIYGAGVNVTARLQTYAEAGGIVISGAVAEQIGSTLGAVAVDLGPVAMRNLVHSVRALSLRLPNVRSSQVGEVPRGHEVRPSIAVLPFREKAAGADQTYFGDGFVDNIIHALAGLKELFVISHSSTAAYSGKPVDIRTVGHELGVRYVLGGSVQRLAGKLRIGMELNDAESGTVIRADHYDGEQNDLFALQDRISQEVVKAIAPHVRQRELLRAMRKHPENMSAYDFVLQALEVLFRLDEASFSKARGLLQQAMNHDPGYAPAYSYAAYWHCYRIGQEWSPNLAIDMGEASRLAAAAIERDADDATALAIYGHVQSITMKDFDAAVRSFDRAIAVCPNSAIAWTFSGATFCFIGDGPSAVLRAETGLRLSPNDSHVFFAEHILSQAHYIGGNYDEAVMWAQRADKHNGRLTSNLRTLAASLVAIGKVEEAREVARRHLQIVPNFSLMAWAARTPMQDRIRADRVERLRVAGMPD